MVQHLEDAPQVSGVPPADPAASLVAAADELAHQGYEPRVLLIPPDWRLIQSLGGRIPARTEPPAWVAAGSEPSFEGVHGKIQIVSSALVPDTAMYLIDPSRWGRWIQVFEAGEEPLAVEAAPFSEGEAESAVQRNTDLERSAPDTPDEERVLRLRGKLRLSVYERFALVVDEPAAARAIPVAMR